MNDLMSGFDIASQLDDEDASLSRAGYTSPYGPLSEGRKIRLPVEIESKLDRMAHEQGMPFAEYVREVLIGHAVGRQDLSRAHATGAAIGVGIEPRMTWIIPSRVLSAYAAASACSTSELISPSEDVVLWATSSGKPSPRRSSWSGWKTRRWSRRLFGQAISPGSRGNSFAAWWTSSLRDSHVNRTPSPADEAAPKTSVGSGRTSSPAFAWFDPASSSWKTSPASDLLGDWMPYSATWPRAGFVLHGRACELTRWAPATKESGSSSSVWPTPDAHLMNDSEAPESFEARRQRNQAKGYNGNGQGTPLGMAVRLWPTPTTMDAKCAGRHTTTTGVMHSGTTSTDAIRAWPMPMSADWRGSAGDGKAELPNLAKSWATPNARDHKGCDLPSRNGGTSLAEQTQTGRFSHRVQSIHDGRELSPTARTLPLRLNPVFGCWLMGWPTWWTNPGPTACARSEMASYLSRLRSLCDIYSESSDVREAA